MSPRRSVPRRKGMVRILQAEGRDEAGRLALLVNCWRNLIQSCAGIPARGVASISLMYSSIKPVLASLPKLPPRSLTALSETESLFAGYG